MVAGRLTPRCSGNTRAFARVLPLNPDAVRRLWEVHCARKPTRPFGRIAFAKDGRVSKEMRQLSAVKESQELEAATFFVESFNALQAGREIADLRQLEQDAHDFSACVGESPLQIQLTELGDRSYTFEMSDEEYNSGRFKEAIQLEYGKRPLRVNPELHDRALWATISKKLAKSYSAPSHGELWLLIFTTNVSYMMEYVNAGVPAVSLALQHARDQLASEGARPFAEVWFTNLQTRPVRVWPPLGQLR